MRQARVRVDAVAMLLFRILHRNMQNPVYYLWTDSSPQFRGREFGASSFDILVSGGVQHRLLPAVALTKGRTSALQKCLCLLWQIMLQVGPSEVQSFCRSVRGICTDMGTERLLARMPIQVLHNFMRHIGCSTWVSLDSEFIFPHALMVPGWRHAFDLVLCKALWQLPWFPAWLKKLKAIVHWVSDRQRVDRRSVSQEEQAWLG